MHKNNTLTITKNSTYTPVEMTGVYKYQLIAYVQTDFHIFIPNVSLPYHNKGRGQGS